MRVSTDSVALVTGASRGIGRATARALASRGARVGLLARSEADLEELAGELGGGALPLPADVGDEASVRAAVERLEAEAGRIDVAVVNAGIAHYAPFADLDLEQAEQMTRINWLGTLYTVSACLPGMLDRASGHLVVVSSGAALRAFPWAAVYGGTKAAQRAFAEALRHELSGTGVSLSTVFPGEITTELHAHEKDRMPDWYRSEDALGPESVAVAIVTAVERDARTAFVPGIVRLLGLNGLAPAIVDRILRSLRGPTSAPRRD